MALTISNGITEIAKRFVPPPRFIPTFETVRVFPPHMPDGHTPNDGTHSQLIAKRFYATRETAEWIMREFGGNDVVEIPGYDNEHKVFAPQLHVDFGVGDHGLPMIVNAGLLAWYFTVRPDAAADDTEGYWLYGAKDADVMDGGRRHVLLDLASTRRER